MFRATLTAFKRPPFIQFLGRRRQCFLHTNELNPDKHCAGKRFSVKLEKDKKSVVKFY